MSDDLNEPGGRNRERINVNQDYELRDWAKKFSVDFKRGNAVVVFALP